MSMGGVVVNCSKRLVYLGSSLYAKFQPSYMSGTGKKLFVVVVVVFIPIIVLSFS